MIEKMVKEILDNRCGLSRGDKLLIGVSGGADSLVVLDLLSKLDYPVQVAHYNHQLREESARDADFVQRIAENKGLKYIYGTGDTIKFAEEKKCSIEEAARELRYQFLFKYARKHNVSAVVVGHNADDQVETIVMHFVRGTGLDGLSGMKYRSVTSWSKKIPLIRPLLGFWRYEIIEYCKRNDLEPRFDLSNLDVTYFRNRLRHDLIPTLESYNPNIKALILKMSETISEDKIVLDQLVDNVLKTSIVERGDSHIALDLEQFFSIELSLQRRFLRKTLSLLRPGLKDIGFDAIENLLSLISNPSRTRQAGLFAGLKLQVEDDRFIISDEGQNSFREEWPQLFSDQDSELSVPGELSMETGWKFEARVFDASSELKESVVSNQDPFTAYMDLNASGNRFVVKQRKPGDRIKPLGMEGKSVKVSDFMINVQLQNRARNHWPLVFSRSRLAWVPGYQISEDVRVRETTKKIVRITLTKQLT